MGTSSTRIAARWPAPHLPWQACIALAEWTVLWWTGPIKEETDGANRAATQITDVHTITVPVSDQDRALVFYVDKLGFEKRLDVSYGQGQRWIEVAPASSATTIALPPTAAR